MEEDIKWMSEDEIIDMLNGEVEKLIWMNKSIAEERDFFHKKCLDLETENKKLKEENDRLFKENEQWKKWFEIWSARED